MFISYNHSFLFRIILDKYLNRSIELLKARVEDIKTNRVSHIALMHFFRDANSTIKLELPTFPRFKFIKFIHFTPSVFSSNKSFSQ